MWKITISCAEPPVEVCCWRVVARFQRQRQPHISGNVLRVLKESLPHKAGRQRKVLEAKNRVGPDKKQSMFQNIIWLRTKYQWHHVQLVILQIWVPSSSNQGLGVNIDGCYSCNVSTWPACLFSLQCVIMYGTPFHGASRSSRSHVQPL